MMNLDLTLSPAYEAALEAHAHEMLCAARARKLCQAYGVALKAHRALPNHTRLCIEAGNAAEAYDAACAACEAAEIALEAACAAAGIEML